MLRAEITREGVLNAIAEFEEMGRDAFLDHYGFNRARDYYIVEGGKLYDSKAIAAVANKWAPGGSGRALTALELSGGKTDAAKRLEALGFTLTYPEQNADWNWDEHVLALDLYMTNPASPPGKQSEAVRAVSALLRRMGGASGAAMNEKFRNANGVYMKMMNFRRFDPSFQSQGKVGLARGSKGEEEIWRRFANDREGLHEAAHAIRKRYAGEDGETVPGSAASIGSDTVPRFTQALNRFRALVAANQKGEPFTGFNEGVVAAYEAYKPRLRKHARSILAPETWTEAAIGSGKILRRVIDAIEIQDDRVTLVNNLVFWQNRYGHANRDHRTLLEAEGDPHRQRSIEEALFALYRTDADEALLFERLSEFTGLKYPLLAYLFFLKDSERFLPIQPTGFDEAFRELGIDLITLRHCDWDNYQRYLAAVGAVRDKLIAALDAPVVDLIDAHSFCWLLVKLPDPSQSKEKPADPGRHLGERAKAIVNMRLSIEQTVRQSNGQQVSRTIKNKDLLIDARELEKVLERLLTIQENRCALTGIAFQFGGADSNLLPSADRIDSQGHYSEDNLQIVCRFVNFWKGSGENDEFKRLLALVRREEI